MRIRTDRPRDIVFFRKLTRLPIEPRIHATRVVTPRSRPRPAGFRADLPLSSRLSATCRTDAKH